jgi:ribonuclease-3
MFKQKKIILALTVFMASWSTDSPASLHVEGGDLDSAISAKGVASNPLFIDLQDNIGYKFINSEHLILALMHRKADIGHTLSSRGNQRLEFLGDAVLELIIRDMLWHDFPYLNNGELHKTSVALVKNSNIALISRDLRLLSISKEMQLTPNLSKLLKPKAQNKADADFIEALIGAIYVDGGMNASRAFVHRYWRLNQRLPAITSIFKNLSTTLENLQAQRQVELLEPLTRSNYDKQYDESLSFLGEAVLGLALKDYLYSDYPEVSEGKLTVMYCNMTTNHAISELCSNLKLGVKTAEMKKFLGHLYLHKGLEHVSQYILSSWGSEDAKQNTKTIFKVPIAIQQKTPLTEQKAFTPREDKLILKEDDERASEQNYMQPASMPEPGKKTQSAKLENKNKASKPNGLTIEYWQAKLHNNERIMASCKSGSKDTSKFRLAIKRIAKAKKKIAELESKRAAQLQTSEVRHQEAIAETSINAVRLKLDVSALPETNSTKVVPITIQQKTPLIEMAPELEKGVSVHNRTRVKNEGSEKPSNLDMAAKVSKKIIPKSPEINVPKNTRKCSDKTKTEKKVEPLTHILFGFTEIPEDWKEWDK